MYVDVLSKIPNSEEITEKAKTGSITRSLYNTPHKYMMMKKIAKKSKEELFCPLEILCQE